MTPAEHFWSLIHELAQVVDENVRNRQITAAFATELQRLPPATRQNFQRDLHLVSFALAHLSENLLPSQSWDQQRTWDTEGSAASQPTAPAARPDRSNHLMEDSLSAMDNEGGPIPGVSRQR